ncbi:MAG: MFS transporter [Steroidobacteraceae bacterium]|jgi:MFS family permease
MDTLQPASREAAGPSELKRGWKMIVAAMIGVACGCSPVPYTSIAQLLGPVHEDTGWSIGQVSLAITLFGLATSVMSPWVGAMADRHGVRRVALVSVALFGLAFGALALTPANIWAWWIAWFLAGLVSVGSGPLSWTRGIGLWFNRQRGLALGIALIGTSFTGVLVPQLAGRAIDQFGWRAVFPLLAALPLLVALPVVWLWFREPRPEERPVGVFEAGKLVGLTAAEAMRGRSFWLLMLSILLIALAYGGINVHLQQMLEIAGFQRAAARDVVSTLAIAILLGRITTGWFLDRIWAPLVTLPVLSMPAVACFLLAGDSLPVGAAYFCALAVGLAAGAETDLIAFLAARYFGMAHYGKIYGILLLPFGLAAGISPAAYGWVRDATGNYDLMLHAAAAMFIVGALLPLALGRYPSFRPSTAAPAVA